MSDRLPLQEETVIFTGTPKSTDVFETVKQLGGKPLSLPLIEVQEKMNEDDQLRLEQSKTYDWLIFTSQSAVDSFASKLARYNVSSGSFRGRLAAVGTRTASALERLGFTVDFIPSVFSADVFVKQFHPNETASVRVLFLRGSLAGKTITEGLPFTVDEWTIYSTEPTVASIDELIRTLQQNEKYSVLFASPSAVEVFAENVAPRIGWTGYTIGAIGHVTEKALVEAGAAVDIIPETYTLKNLVEVLATRKEVT